MKHMMKNISPLLAKLFVIVFVILLSACSKETPVVVEDGEIAEKKSCMGCEILTMIYDAVNDNVTHLHTEFTQAAMTITMLGFAIWLALRLLKFVSSVTETNAGEVWNEILRKAFICTLCGLLAANSAALQYTLNFLVFPIYMAFLNLGSEILGSALTKDTNAFATKFMVFGEIIEVPVIEQNICKAQPLVLSGASVGFPDSIKLTMECMINQLDTYLDVGGDIAWKAMSAPVLMGIPTVMGFILMMFFWVVRMGFVFYLVDCIFQMGIIILLLPLFIISYAFGPTRKWTGVGLSKVLASAGFMMCFAIIVFMVIRAMVSLLTNPDNKEIFNPSDSEAPLRDISIGFMCLFMIGFLIYGSMGVSQQLTSGLIGGKVDANFQKNLKAVVQTGIKMIGTALGALFTWGMAVAPASNIALVRNTAKVIKNVQKIHEKIQRLAGRR